MRTRICAGNWKMYKTPEEAQTFLREWVTVTARATAADADAALQVSSRLSCKLIIFPPAYNLCVFSLEASRVGIEFGAQNIYFAKEGAFTGELSPAVVKSLGAQWALIGHSERRTLFGETEVLIAKKILAAFENGLSPMLCVGETLAEREAGATEAVIEKQLSCGLGLVKDKIQTVARDKNLLSQGLSKNKLVIAYEPVWAIGTGKVATPLQAEDVHLFIREYFKKKYGKDFSDSISILYGGSVKPENARELAAQKNIDGFLVGGASLKPDDFSKIAESL